MNVAPETVAPDTVAPDTTDNDRLGPGPDANDRLGPGPDAPEVSPGRQTVQLVVTAKTILSTNKLGFVLQEVLEGQRVGELLYFGARGLAVHVGHQYAIDARRDATGKVSTLWYDTARWAGQWPNGEERLRWEAATRAGELARSAQREQRKAETQNLIKDTLAPLRTEWRTTSHQRRLALEVLVLHYLRTGDILDD